METMICKCGARCSVVSGQRWDAENRRYCTAYQVACYRRPFGGGVNASAAIIDFGHTRSARLISERIWRSFGRRKSGMWSAPHWRQSEKRIRTVGS